MNKIYLLIGESGAGKTTVVEKIKEMSNLKSIDSYTTRPKRYDDEVGHIFITDKEFDNLQNICAYTEINGYRYAATSKQVDENDIYIIDVAGIDYFTEYYKGMKDFRIIYLHCSETERARRMRLRGDSEKAIQNRLTHDKTAFLGALSIADILVASRKVNQAAKKIVKYIGDCNE